MLNKWQDFIQYELETVCMRLLMFYNNYEAKLIFALDLRD